MRIWIKSEHHLPCTVNQYDCMWSINIWITLTLCEVKGTIILTKANRQYNFEREFLRFYGKLLNNSFNYNRQRPHRHRRDQLTIANHSSAVFVQFLRLSLIWIIYTISKRTYPNSESTQKLIWWELHRGITKNRRKYDRYWVFHYADH